jgi:hypothetical protein
VELNGIVSPIVVTGGEGMDELIINTRDDDGSSCICDAYSCTGFGIGGAGIQFAGIEMVTINGGFGDDTFEITSTGNTTWSINGGHGDDEYSVVASLYGFDSITSNIEFNDNATQGVNVFNIIAGSYRLHVFVRAHLNFGYGLS